MSQKSTTTTVTTAKGSSLGPPGSNVKLVPPAKRSVRPVQPGRLLGLLVGSSTDQQGENSIVAASLDQTAIGSNASRRDHVSVTSHGGTFGHSHVAYENTYRLEPQVKFEPGRAERLIRRVVNETLKGRNYDAADSKTLCQDLSQTVLEQVKADQSSMAVRRYKYVCMVSIGSLLEKPGVHFSSRSLWGSATDNYVTVQFTGDTLYAVVALYALYYE